MAVKEAVHNAIKHSGAGEVTIRVSFDDPLLAISVHDDGTGFELAGATSGHGLGNMKRRMESIRGKMTIESNLGAGTTIRLEIVIRPVP
jgi:signal transduction histidine kinase